MGDATAIFSIHDKKDYEIHEIVQQVYDALKEKGYNPENDVDNPRDSVFCSHGAGHVVKWYDVPQNMHLESFLKPKKEETEETFTAPTQTRVRGYLRSLEDDKDLLRIFEITTEKSKKRIKSLKNHGQKSSRAM